MPKIQSHSHSVTPQNRDKNHEATITVNVPSSRRNSDMISESSQNIFNRRFSRPKLSRQDSIFTHTSNMAVT